MSESFDHYHKWLGIPPDEQPPHYYRLLGLGVFEVDNDVIEAAADRQMSHVQTYKMGAHSVLSQRLLNELAAARLCLLSPARKAEYDRKLRTKLPAKQAAPPAPPPPPPAGPPPPPPQFGSRPFVAPIAAKPLAKQPPPLPTADSASPLTFGSESTGGSSPYQRHRRQRQQASGGPLILFAAMAVLLVAGAAGAWWWWQSQVVVETVGAPANPTPPDPAVQSPVTPAETPMPEAAPTEPAAVEPKVAPPTTATNTTPEVVKPSPSRAPRTIHKLEEARTFDGHTEPVTCLAISPDGRTLVSGSRDLTVRVWDIASGQEQHRLSGHEFPILAVAVTGDDRIVTAGKENAIYVWDLIGGTLIRRVPLSFKPIEAIVLSHDGRRAFLDSKLGVQNLAVLWNVENGRQIGDALDLPSPVLALAMSHDGNSLAAALSNHTTRIYVDMNAAKPGVGIKELQYVDFNLPESVDTQCLVFSPNDRLLLGGSRRGSMNLADIVARRDLGNFVGHTAPVRGMAFSADGRYVFTGGGPPAEDAAADNPDRSVRIWDVASRRQLASFDGQEGSVQAIAYDSATRAGFSAGDDLVIREWRLPENKSPDEPASLDQPASN